MNTKNLRKLIFSLALSLFTLFSCTKNLPLIEPKADEIIIISTNDIHGAIENIPQLSTLVDELRTQSKHVLVVDAGDRWTGNPNVDFYEPPYIPIVELMNDVKYDIATIGNHEFDKGLSILANRTSLFNFSTVLANISSSSTPFAQPNPYIIKTVGGIRLCFLGLIDNSQRNYPPGNRENFGDAIFTNPLVIANSYKSLKNESDVFIGLTHIGVELDVKLAQQMPELDLIIGGHSHTVIPNGKLINNILITQTGKNLQYAGITRLKFNEGKLISCENSLITLNKIIPNKNLQQKVEQYNNNPALDRSLGSFSHKMDKTSLLNFASDAMRDNIQSDFALYNKGSLRIDNHPSGDFTLKDLFSMEPFGNTVCVIQMTLKDLKDLILAKFNTIGGEGHTADIFPSGMCYTIETDAKGDGINVIFYNQNWEEITGSQTYKIAMSDFINENYNFPLHGTGITTSKLITDIIISYLDKYSPVTSPSSSRVKIVPK